MLEAAAVGCIMAFGFTVLRGRQAVLRQVLSQTAATTSLIYIIIGATIFTFFVTPSQLPNALVGEIEASGLEPWMVILLLVAMYIVPGSIFKTVAAITLPVEFPLAAGLGFDPIWWGIINIMVIEIGQITPPIGIIPFVLHGMAPEVPLKTIFLGIAPFFIADLARLAIISLFPALCLWLPKALGPMF